MRSLAVIATIALFATASTVVHAVPVVDTSLTKSPDSGYDMAPSTYREYTVRARNINVPVRRSIDPERKRLYQDDENENKNGEALAGEITERSEDGVVIRRSVAVNLGSATGNIDPDLTGSGSITTTAVALATPTIPAVGVTVSRRQSEKGSGPSRDGAL